MAFVQHPVADLYRHYSFGSDIRDKEFVHAVFLKLDDNLQVDPSELERAKCLLFRLVHLRRWPNA